MATVSGKGTTVKRRRYSRKFQRMAVERMETCEDVGELARELEVRSWCLYKWRKKLESIEPGQEASLPSTHASAHRKRNPSLEAAFGGAVPRVIFFARQPEYRAHLPAGFGQSQQFLPIPERTAASRGRDGSAICDSGGAESALGGRHHLHPIEKRSLCSSGCLFAKSGGLGIGQDVGGAIAARGTATSSRRK